MPRRTRARAAALQVLFQDDLSREIDPAASDEFLRRRLREDDLYEFARSLVSGVRRNREELDHLLETAADNWSLERMSATDRNALRIGAFEMVYTDAPPAVVIDEALELAKRFGGENSGRFVNGVLDQLHRRRQEG